MPDFEVLDYNSKPEVINRYLKAWKDFGNDRGEISDGYHSFNELYQHRIRLYIQLCKSKKIARQNNPEEPLVWYSEKHSDRSVWDGWFMLGIGEQPGKQITYHLPSEYWDEVSRFAVYRTAAPEYDGHSPQDVLTRLLNV